jgi:hypothetical protein
MPKRNPYAGYCSVCGAAVGANQGITVHDPESPYAHRPRGYLILCVEHAGESSFELPAPPEASKLPSIHRGEEKYER